MASAAAAATVVIMHRKSGGGSASFADRAFAFGTRDAQQAQLLQEERRLNRLFRKYDTNRSHKLEPDQVWQLLKDLDQSGELPTDEEVRYIIALCDEKCVNGSIDRSELKQAIDSWKSYVNGRKQLTQAMEVFDESCTGKLEREELKNYLTYLNMNMEVTDEEVDWVMRQACVLGEGSCSKPELAGATAAWYKHADRKGKGKKGGCCVIS